jgi:2-polyprenyl-6-methoxyphenol hydroxylase-like FAD-dependent oxidoreductase
MDRDSDGTGFDVLVHGSGIVGCAAALALRDAGLRVAMAHDAQSAASRASTPPDSTPPDSTSLGSTPPDSTPPDSAFPRADIRAYAISAASRALLEQVGAWQLLPADASTPVYDMRIEGDSRERALGFSAWQQRVRELASIVDAGALAAALAQRVAEAGIARVPSKGTTAALDVIAEGKASASRARKGARFVRHDYGQTAVAARLASDRAHEHTARQWFLSPDVLALLPFDRPRPGHSFGLVWSVPTARAAQLRDMPADAFEHELAQATQDAAGTLRLASDRACWPLAIGRADPVAGAGWVLVGDAAHVVHPLAGQGLNLGLGDVAALAGVMAARESWRGAGDERLLARYARQRAWPVAAMSGVTDALQVLFAHSSPIAKELRNRGLGLVDSMSAVKRWLASEALGR